jgi:hypothetical protein
LIVAFPAERPFAEKVTLKACMAPPVTEAPAYCGLVVDTMAVDAGDGAALTVTWANDPTVGVTVTVTTAEVPTASALWESVGAESATTTCELCFGTVVVVVTVELFALFAANGFVLAVAWVQASNAF